MFPIVEFEKEIEKESLSQGVSLELRESQMRDYQRFKEEAARKTGQCQEQLDALLREQKLDQDSLDNEMRKRNDAELKIKQKPANPNEHQNNRKVCLGFQKSKGYQNDIKLSV